MTIRDGQPSPKQARMMAKVFVIATLLGALAVFVNVTLRSYAIRQQQAELKSRETSGAVAPSAPASTVPEPAQTTPQTQP